MLLMPRTRPSTPADVRRLFGARVRSIRLRLGFSQEELADRAHLDRTYISSLERGHRNVGLENICRLAGALNVDPAELLAGLPAPTRPA